MARCTYTSNMRAAQRKSMQKCAENMRRKYGAKCKTVGGDDCGRALAEIGRPFYVDSYSLVWHDSIRRS